MKREAYVRVLRSAKDRLQTEALEPYKLTCICWALSAATGSKQTKHALQKLIRQRLDGNVSLELWLRRKHRIKPQYSMDGQNAHRKYCMKIQRTRHAWIDALIEEFS